MRQFSLVLDKKMCRKTEEVTLLLEEYALWTNNNFGVNQKLLNVVVKKRQKALTTWIWNCIFPVLTGIFCCLGGGAIYFKRGDSFLIIIIMIIVLLSNYYYMIIVLTIGNPQQAIYKGWMEEKISILVLLSLISTHSRHFYDTNKTFL